MGSFEQDFLYFVFMDTEGNSCYHGIPGRFGNAIYLVLLGSSLSLSRLQLAVLTFLLMFQLFLHLLMLEFHVLLGRGDLCPLSRIPVLIYVRGSYSASREVQQDPVSRRGRLDLLYD